MKTKQLAPHIHKVFGNLESWLNGIHHGVDPKYMQAYLDEFVFRFNRHEHPIAAFLSLLVIVVSKHPFTHNDLTKP
ncbi:MAG: transposase [Candidatus Brocadiaceae bacterium]|nr:transposase [Candidatus Brocadiaceae bacterium]